MAKYKPETMFVTEHAVKASCDEFDIMLKRCNAKLGIEKPLKLWIESSLCDSGYNSRENSVSNSPTMPAFIFKPNELESIIIARVDAVSEDLDTKVEQNHDSSNELTPPQSDGEDSFVESELHRFQEPPKPRFEYLSKVSLAVDPEVYQESFSKAAKLDNLVDVPNRTACPLGQCTKECLVNPCYAIDEMVDYIPTITETGGKTTRIYLDFTGKAALIYFPRSQKIRLLAQKLNANVATEISDFRDLDDEPAKYRFESDISKFLRSKGVVVYSTSPITDCYRDLADNVDGFNPCERPQHELIAHHGTRVHVPNMFLGNREEFKLFAEQREFSQDQRDVVTFHEECEDYLNQYDDFISEPPPDRDEEEDSEHTKEELCTRNKAVMRFEESKKLAHGQTLADTKDPVVLYCMENADRVCGDDKAIGFNFEQEHRPTQEEKVINFAEELSFSGQDMMQKTASPHDFDRVVYRVVAWLENDSDCYEAIDHSLDTCDCNDHLTPTSNEVYPCLSSTTSATYDQIVASIEPTLEAMERVFDTAKQQNPSTYKYTLTSPTEANASKHKKHIYLDTPTAEIEVNFSPCTQNLTITAKNILTCQEFNVNALPSHLMGKQIYTPVFNTTVNCIIYSTHPIQSYIVDYTLPEVTEAPRTDRKALARYLKEHCEEFLAFAPYAKKFKTNLGAFSLRTLKNRMKIAGLGGEGEGECEMEEEEE